MLIVRLLNNIIKGKNVKINWQNGLWFTLVIMVLQGCSNAVMIDSDHQAGIDFSHYKAYRWHDNSDAARSYHGNDILDNRIREAIDLELSTKGYILKETGDVDFQVNYSVTIKDKTDVQSYNNYGGPASGFSMGYGRGHYRYGYSLQYYNQPEVVTVHYKEGTFIVDIVDPENKLVWRGSAEGRLKKNRSVEEKRTGIKTVVNKVLALFPPEPHKH